MTELEDTQPPDRISKIALIEIEGVRASLERPIHRIDLTSHAELVLQGAAEMDPGLTVNTTVLKNNCTFSSEAKAAVTDADLVVLGTSCSSFPAVIAELASVLKPSAVITELNAVNHPVLEQLKSKIPPHLRFVQSQLLASMKSDNPSLADPNREYLCVIMPNPMADIPAILTLQGFWVSFGAKVEILNPKDRDTMIAVMLLLPHLITHNIVATIEDLETTVGVECTKFSAEIFSRFTSSILPFDPSQLGDSCVANRDVMLEVLGRFSELLASMQRFIRWGEAEKLTELLTRTGKYHYRSPDVPLLSFEALSSN